MLKLAMNFTAADRAQKLAEEGTTLERVTTQISYYETLWAADLSMLVHQKMVFKLENAVNCADPDDVYDEVEVAITGRMVQDGQRWFVGDGIALSLSSALEELVILRASL